MTEPNFTTHVDTLILAYQNVTDESPHPVGLAAAIRALADQVIDERCQNESERRIYDRLRRIAAELDQFLAEQGKEAPSTAPKQLKPVAYDAGNGVTIVQTGQRPEAWAIRNDPLCLSVNGTWDYEPMPSNRTREWLDDHRFPTLNDEAIAVESLINNK